MHPLISGLFLTAFSCDLKWTFFKPDTLALFKSNDTLICCDFISLMNDTVDYKKCYDFVETVKPDTIFQSNNNTYVIGKSMIDDSHLIVIDNENYTQKLFSYGFHMLRYNIFNHKIYDYSNKSLIEYDLKAFIDSLSSNISLKPEATFTLSHVISDYQFYGKNNFSYLTENDVYVNDKLFVKGAPCMPFLSPEIHTPPPPKKESSVYEKIKFLLCFFLFLSLLFSIVYVWQHWVAFKEFLMFLLQ